MLSTATRSTIKSAYTMSSETMNGYTALAKKDIAITFQRYLSTLTLSLVIITLLSSCSSTRLAYNYLDFYMQWKINAYVTLTSEQKALSKKGIQEFHDWHRATQLPKYAHYLTLLKPHLNSNSLNGQLIHEQTDQLQLLLDDSITHLMPTLVDLAHSLTHDQVNELKDKLRKKRQEYAKEYVNIDTNKVEKKRIDDLRQYMDDFFGKYSVTQTQWINTWSEQLIPYESLMLTQQENWANHLVRALDHRQDKKKLHTQLQSIVLYRTDNWDKTLNDILDKNQAVTYDLVATLVKSQSQKQRKKLNKRLDQHINDFTRLNKAQ